MNRARRGGPPAIHFALTSHGLGHVTRSLAVIRALHALRPELAIVISSTLEAAWLRAQLGFDVHCRHQAYEPGAIQETCFTVDVPATIAAYAAFESRREAAMEEELRFLGSRRFDAVVSDIPALPVAAAAQAGLPAIGVSNFTWDWILEPWCGDEHAGLVEILRSDYAAGTLQLCLPFGPERSSFPDREPAPLVSRSAAIPRDEVRRRLELGPEPLAVVCPGGWDADDWPPIQARPGEFQLVTVNELPVSSDGPCRKLGHTLPSAISMPDLVATADVVLGKPGYGLASECLTHRIPFAMIERPNFRETPFLVAQMQELGRCTTLTLDEFFSGEWERHLAAAQTNGSAWSELQPEPDRIIAERLLRFIA